MKQILILSNHHAYTYNFRKEVIQSLLNEGHKVCIVAPYGEKIELLKEMGCEYLELSLDRRGINLKNDIQLMYGYHKIVRRVKPDVILSYTIKPNIYGGIVSRVHKIPFIPNVTGLGSAASSNKLISKLVLFLYRLAFKKTSHVFFQNKENRDFFLNNGFKLNYEVLPGSGVNLNEYVPAPYPIESNTYDILYVGRVMKEKGVNELLSAAKILENRAVPVQFRLAGFLDDGFDISNLSEHKNVELLGARDDVPSLIEKAHAIILPSYHEGMSNALLEAAASGRPLLASDIAGCREIIDDNKNGFLFEAKSANSIVDKVEAFISTSYAEKVRMGSASRNKVEEEFDRSIIVKAYLNKITEVTQ